MNWKKKRFLIPVMVVAFLVIGRALVSTIDRYPSLATTLLPNGQELRLHAVLKPTDPPFLIDSGGFLSKSTERIHNPGTGLVFVFSCRDPDNSNWLGFDWFGSLSVKDRHGVDVLANNDDISVKQRQWKFTRSSGNESSGLGDPEVQVPLPNQNSYRFLKVSVAIPEIPEIEQVEILDADRNYLAQIEVEVSLQPADRSFTNDHISFAASNEEWQATIFELEYSEYRGLGQFEHRRTVQASIQTKLNLKRDGSTVSKGDFVQGPATFTDPMGNQHGGLIQVLPYGPTVWKYSTGVARNTTAEFSSEELRPMGTFTIPAKAQTIPTTCQQNPRHIVVVPAGKSEVTLDAQLFSIQHPDDRWNYTPTYRQFALGANLKNVPDTASTSNGSGFSSGGETWKANASLSMNLGQDTDQIQVSSEVNSSSSFDDTLYSTDSPWPLVMLALEPDEQNPEHVHHLIVLDSSGTAVPVRPCFHSIKHVPVYALNVEPSHNQPLAFFYHSEPLRELEFTIPSPHTVIERPDDPDESFVARLVPDGDSWVLISK